jgi:hypothetical protein
MLADARQGEHGRDEERGAGDEVNADTAPAHRQYRMPAR